MEKVFDEVDSLDKRCYEQFRLTEDILMEHAANSMNIFIRERFSLNSKIVISCGVGNNGADGIALARLLSSDYIVKLFIPYGTKSAMGQLQLKRVKLLGIEIVDELREDNFDIVVDCLFGSGLNRKLSDNYLELIKKLNSLSGYKLACDIPSGILDDGTLSDEVFICDTTITMGALKKALFGDMAKDFVGDIKVANLGVSREIYETSSNTFLLEKSDLKLPIRSKQLTHKGTFGHIAVITGEKEGASILSASVAIPFGAGLVSCVSCKNILNLPYSIMQSKILPKTTTAIAIGMGLGKVYDKSILENNIPKVLDADIFYDEVILEQLEKENVVLTPHPKEFCSLLSLCGIVSIDLNKLQQQRFKYLKLFCQKYPKVVLLLKGANVLIAKDDKVYINTYGSSILSFGGSGDILSGLIGSLLAQGYSSLDAAISGTLAHTLAASNYTYSNYSLTPDGLIEEIKKL